MRRISIGIALLAAIAAAILVWRCDRGAKTQPSTKATSAASAKVHASTKTATSRPLPAWFARKGAPAKNIAGRVTHGGRPVANASVSLHSALTRAGVVDVVSVRTGADGKFDFGPHPASWYQVAASADGLTAAIAVIDTSDPMLKPPADQLELVLRDCSFSVEGTVFDAAGNPLPKTSVERNGLVGTLTDARGAYKLCVPFGDVELEFRADGYGGIILTIDARGQVQRDVVLVPEVAIEVRVVRMDSNEPVRDAHVFAFPKQWGPERARNGSGVTDGEGRVRLAGLVPGRYNIGGWADGLQAERQEEVLAEVGVNAQVVLRMDATVQLSGKVTSNGQPIAGARVVAVRKSPSFRSPPSMSQLDGSFVNERAPAGELAFSAQPYEVITPTTFEAKSGKSYDNVAIDVRALGVIRGRVTRLGKPVEGADMCCVRIPANPPSVRTDADGRYEFVGVPPGTYEVGGGSDAIGAFSLGGKVTVGPGETKIFDFELDMAGTIAGVVVDREGKPVRGVFVRWIHEKTNDVGRAVTDAQGRFRCGAMTGGGKYRAAVFPSAELQQVPYPTADGSPYPVIDVKDGTTLIENVKIAIDRPSLAIKGRVIDDTGAPIADAIVKALPSKDGQPQFHPWLRLPTTSTNTDGTFTLAELAPGNYVLFARLGNGGEGIASKVAAGTTDVIIRVQRPGSIEGKLVGFTQPPDVTARTIGTFEFSSGTVDGATFRVDGLRPGRYLVSAQTTYEGDAHVVDIKAGEIEKLVMTSRGRGSIEGTVLDFRTRAPLANAICRVVPTADGEQVFSNWDPSTAPRSDAKGRVVLDPAPAGAVDVACDMPSFRWSRASTAVTLAAGERAKAELLSVELTQENPSTIGVNFDWRVTPPRIARVDPDTPAAKAGLLVGDLVTDVGDASTKNLNSAGVAQLIASTPIGNEVRIRVLRNKVVKTFTVTAVNE